MTEIEHEGAVWDSLTEPAQTPFVERQNELTGLVHYSSFSALHGIIENEEIWFSPVAAMNDFDEVTKGKQMLEFLSSPNNPLSQVIDGIIEVGSRAGISFEHAYNTSKDSDLFETFISCWSTYDPATNSHDNLSMWRGYASDGNGAAILIDPMNLGLMNLFSSHIVAYPVYYETEIEFVARAKRAFTHFLNNLCKFSPEVLKAQEQHALQAFTDLCFQLAISHKHPGFHAEREWRFVWRRHREFEDRFISYVRPQVGPRGMFEYFCLPIKTDEAIAPVELNIRDLVKEIMVGPTRDAFLKMQATRALLKKNEFDLDRTKVTQSYIPYRAI